MASGRCSGDPTDLLLVDPSRPEAMKWARKHLTKRQKDIFIQYGFSKALFGEVIGSGWDQADINNYVLYYNGQVEASLVVPASGLDMSMKRAINTIIRTKLQAQEEEEEEEEEQEIGLVTPANQKEYHLQESLLNQIWGCYPRDQGRRLVEGLSLVPVYSRNPSPVHDQ